MRIYFVLAKPVRRLHIVQCDMDRICDVVHGVTHFLGVSSLNLRPELTAPAFFLSFQARRRLVS